MLLSGGSWPALAGLEARGGFSPLNQLCAYSPGGDPTVRERLKTWATTRPKRCAWFYLAMALFLYAFIGKYTTYFAMISLGFMSGDMPPEEFAPIFEKTAGRLAEAFIVPIEKLFMVGHDYAATNPARGMLMGQAISYASMAVIFMIATYIFHGTVRHIVVDIYEKAKKRERK